MTFYEALKRIITEYELVAIRKATYDERSFITKIRLTDQLEIYSSGTGDYWQEDVLLREDIWADDWEVRKENDHTNLCDL